MFHLICILIIYNLLRDVLSFLIGLARVLMAAAILFVSSFASKSGDYLTFESNYNSAGIH